MKRVIAASMEDRVSVAVARVLVESYGFRDLEENVYRRGDVELRLIREKHIFAEKLGEKLGADLVVVPSSHKSEKGVRALLTHPVGNWGDEALFGGRPKTLSATSASMLRTSLQTLLEEADRLGIKDRNIGLEVTHHGPATDVPLIFVEVGGPEDEEPDRRALEAVASASLAAARVEFRSEDTAIGFGGGHYAPTFTKLVARSDYSLGHMCPKYALPVERKMIAQAVKKTVENPGLAVIDWKGVTSEQRRTVLSVLEELGIDVIKA